MILLVDDEPSILTIFQLILSMEGHEVRTALKGDEAITFVARGGIDLVVCDVRMSPVDGFEVLRQVRQLQPGIPVIIVSAYGDPDAISKLVALGALSFLQKPTSPAQLVEAVNNALGIKGQA